MGATALDTNPLSDVAKKTMLVKATCIYLERLLLQKYRGSDDVNEAKMNKIDQEIMTSGAKGNITIEALLQLFCRSLQLVTMEDIDKQIRIVKANCFFLERALVLNRKRGNAAGTPETKEIEKALKMFRQLQNFRLVYNDRAAAAMLAGDITEMEAGFYRKCVEMDAKCARDLAEMKAEGEEMKLMQLEDKAALNTAATSNEIQKSNTVEKDEA